MAQRREQLPTPVSWPGEFHGLYSPCSHKEPLFYYRTEFHLSTGPGKCVCVCVWLYVCVSPRKLSALRCVSNQQISENVLIPSSVLSSIFQVLKPWRGPWHCAKLSLIFSSLPPSDFWFSSYQFSAASWILGPIGCCSCRKHTLLYFS